MEICTAKDLCNYCGKPGHFMKDCNNKYNRSNIICCCICSGCICSGCIPKSIYYNIYYNIYFKNYNK